MHEFLLYNARHNELVRSLQAHQSLYCLLANLINPDGHLELVPACVFEDLFGHFVYFLVDVFVWEGWVVVKSFLFFHFQI